MAIIKCKMCGGDLNLTEGQCVAQCEYCGSTQTVPTADNEKKLTLFARANRLRAACEFDKAAGIYESIVAEYPEEAESYWGLVLCKYGIEYVTDPATGKKIPTCHRSSFDSVMDDGNFDQAMENADPVALKLYREEAKTIEGLRRGILEVSSSERPYDIFICYKETDSQGSRTLDSVIAQDLYDALTGKGYRVFFSRITLEDKLGQAYEPYIFAALNSAKVMLAIGTCYEHYNAVWVKNEWSRFLKLMGKNKDKFLIPCYKNLDAYDIPKEFQHLQGMDLGRMGAIQDLIRNMEKYIPLQKQTVVQEKVVVGGSGNNKIASLLDRGNMALEDGDWAKADSFFEDVLNNDSKNAQAYLGKTLAQEKCRTIDAFIRKRKEIHQNVRSESRLLEPYHGRIEEAVRQYSLPGYVEPKQLEMIFYNFDLHYPSDAEGRTQQYRAEENYWANHKLLSRAEKFATGEVAQNLQREKTALLAFLADRAKRAEQAAAAAREALSSRYAAHLDEAGRQAAGLYEEGLARREKDYQHWLSEAKTETDIRKLQYLAAQLYGLGDYKDSAALSEHCLQKIREEEEKLAAEKERLRILRIEQEKRRQAKNRKILILSAICVVAAVTVFLLMTKVFIPQWNYDAAEEMLANGEYAQAMEAFGELEDYRDSRDAARYAEICQILTCARSRDLTTGWLLVAAMDGTKPQIPSASESAAVEVPPTVPQEPEDEITFDAEKLKEFFKVMDEVAGSYSEDTWRVLLESGSAEQYLKDALLKGGFMNDETVAEAAVKQYLGDDTTQDTQQEKPFTVDLSLSEEDASRIALYEKVKELFCEMGDYRDCFDLREQITQEQAQIEADHYGTIYAQGEQYLAAGEYDKAIVVFDALKQHIDSNSMSETAREEKQAAIDRANAESYAGAEKRMQEKQYEKAYLTFRALGTYSDSAKKALDCAALAAETAEAAQRWKDALEWYKICGDREGMNRAKYGYVQSHYIHTDLTTYDFLKELKQAGYQDAQKLYDQLYQQKFTIVVNKNRTDTTTHSTSISVQSEYDDIYVHILYTGGTPEQKVVNVSAVVEYYTDGKWVKWSSSYVDSLTDGQWRYEDFMSLGYHSFRFVLKNLDTKETIQIVPINVY